jgi:ATP/maltotriose-dependent transcriptional regulator MalT
VAGLQVSAIGHLREALDGTPRGAARDEVARELAPALAFEARALEAVGVLDRAISECPDEDVERRLRLEGDRAMLGLFEDDLMRSTAARAERLATGLDGGTAAERVLLAATAYWRALSAYGSGSEAAALAERAIGRGQLLREQGWLPYINTAQVLLAVDRDDSAQRYLQLAIDDARARGAGPMLALASIAISRVFMFRGELAEAEVAARLALEVVPRERNRYTWYGGVAALLLALVERGDLDAAEALLKRSRADGELPSLGMAQTLLWVRLTLHGAQDRLTEAAADAEDLLARHRRRGHAGLPHRAAIALALFASGRQERARAIAQEFLEIAQGWGAPSTIGVAQTTLGTIVGGQPGLDLHRRAVATLQETPCRLELARSLAVLGAALRRSNQRTAAREPLRRALELAHRCGADGLTREVSDELRACGARPRQLVRSGVDSLTPSERRVAVLVAQGMSNPEVAQSLFVTRSTVETHLRAVYSKLDIASREELSPLLGR